MVHCALIRFTLLVSDTIQRLSNTCNHSVIAVDTYPCVLCSHHLCDHNKAFVPPMPTLVKVILVSSMVHQVPFHFFQFTHTKSTILDGELTPTKEPSQHQHRQT